MKILKSFSKKGFTLIEIIVVLIILGVLAAIALPNLFGNIKKSKAAEALSSINSLKVAVEGCIYARAATGTQDTCGASLLSSMLPTQNFNYSFGSLNMGGPGVNGWSPISGSGDNSDVSYTIAAQGKGVNGLTGSDYIILERDTATTPARFKCSAGGALKGAC